MRVCNSKCGDCTLGCVRDLIETNKDLQRMVKLVDTYSFIGGTFKSRRSQIFNFMKLGVVREMSDEIENDVKNIETMNKQTKVEGYANIEKKITNKFKNSNNYDIPDNQKEEIEKYINEEKNITDKEINKLVSDDEYIKNFEGLFLPGGSEIIKEETNEQLLESLREERLQQKELQKKGQDVESEAEEELAHYGIYVV